MTVNFKQGSGLFSFGNSIPAGGNAINIANGYANRLAAHVGGPFSNYSISGTGVKSITDQGYKFLPYGTRPRLVTWDGPLNDVRRYGAQAVRALPGALTAFLSTAFQGMFRFGNHPSVVRTGAWAPLGATYGGRAFFWGGSYAPMYTNDPNASWSHQFSGDLVAIHAYLTESGAYKDFDIEIDGQHFQTNFAGKALPTEIACGGAILIDGCGPGLHNLTLRPLSGGATTVIDGMSVPVKDGFAPVLLGLIPHIGDWTAFGSIGTLADAEAANQIITDIGTLWKGLGFPVEVVDVNETFVASRDAAGDTIHPLDAGHGNYFLPWANALRLTNT